MFIFTAFVISDLCLTNLSYGVAVGLTVKVGVALPRVGVAIGVPAVPVLVGLITGGMRVGVMDTTGGNVAVQVGVIGSAVGGGQTCSLTVNWWQSLSWHTFTLREELLGARQSTICLS